MTENSQIAIFEEKRIRRHWDGKREKWYFSVVDIISVLTESTNPTDYLKKLRKRDSELGHYIGTNCPQVEMVSETGKNRKVLAGNPKHLFRIIQSIPSKKAEPIKIWLAKVGYERIQEIEDPELAISSLSFPRSLLSFPRSLLSFPRKRESSNRNYEQNILRLYISQ